MSEAQVPGGEPGDPYEPEEPGEAEVPEETAGTKPAPRVGAVRRVVTGRRSRWVVGAGAALVLVAATATVTAVTVHHGEEGLAVRAFPGGPDGPGGVPGLKRLIAQGEAGGGSVVVKGGQVVALPAPGAGATQWMLPGTNGGGLAPAPLPALPADQAVTKAAAAVTGGKVETLAPVPEQGGGTAWQAVVLGPDGVRHMVTLDGSTGAVTSNTVMG